MTEDDAKQKWCPMTRVARVSGHGSINRFGPAEKSDGIPSGARCIGSDCMMWTEVRRYNNKDDFVVEGGYCSLSNPVPYRK